DAAIAGFVASLDRDEVVARLRAAEVAVGAVHEIDDVVRDPHLQDRGFWVATALSPSERGVMPRPIPHLEGTPGAVHHLGPALGAHSRAVLRAWGGLDDAAI